MRSLRLLGSAAVLALLIAPVTHADQWNKRTYLTFSAPVQVPGVTLPAGTYMFKLADSESNRHIVQIFDKDGGKLYATILAVPDNRLDPPDRNLVLFRERPAGVPQAIKAWWYPGDSYGDEFVYPKSQAVRIARDTHQPVLATEDERSSDRKRMKAAKVGRMSERGEMAEESRTAQAPAPAEPAGTHAPTTTGTGPTSGTTATTGTTGTIASGSNMTGTTAARSDTNAAPRRRRLPQTGSELGLLELLSGLSFAGAVGMRQLRKRFAE